MATSAFIIWDFTPEVLPAIFENLPIHPRWYGFLFALGFLIGYQIMKKIFIREKIKVEWVDSLLMYVMVGTVLGARLGHVLFYDFADYIKNPISILYIWEGGLASHGAVIGNITALWLWSRKISKKKLLWILDRVVITIAIAGALIRMGNFLNSEIYGKPTGNSSGYVFVNPAISSFIGNNGIASIDVESREGDGAEKGNIPLNLKVRFDKSITNEQQADELVTNYLVYNFKISEHIRENILVAPEEEVPVEVIREGKELVATVPVFGIARYPTQLYETAGYFIIFLLLVFLYWKKNMGEKTGIIFGTFILTIFGFRFCIEFLKANQSAFEDGLALNMGQILSIPLVIAGLYFIFMHKKHAGSN